MRLRGRIAPREFARLNSLSSMKNSPPFSKGYAFHGTILVSGNAEMTNVNAIYIFTSQSHSAVSALTEDQTGGNLPTAYAPWRPLNGGRRYRPESRRRQLSEPLSEMGSSSQATD